MAMASLRWRDVTVPTFIAGMTTSSDQPSQLFGPADQMTRRTPPPLQDIRPSTLREQHRRLLEVLERTEEERDLALERAKAWEERLAKAERDRVELQCQLGDAEKAREAELHRQAAEAQAQSTQHQQMHDDQERLDQKVRERIGLEERLQQLTCEGDHLRHTCSASETAKESDEQQLASIVKDTVAREEELENEQSQARFLQAQLGRAKAHAQTQMAVLEQELQRVKKVSMEHLQRLQHNEVREHYLSQVVNDLRTLLGELEEQKEEIRQNLQKKARDSGDVTLQTPGAQRQQQLEGTIEHLKHSLDCAYERNARLQECMLTQARSFFNSGSDEDLQVKALMDQLCQSHQKLRSRTLAQVHKQGKLSELHARCIAMQREAENVLHERAIVQKESEVTLAARDVLREESASLESLHCRLSAQREEAEQSLKKLGIQDVTLQVDNDYLASRIEGNKLDISAIKRELKQSESRVVRESQVTSHLKQVSSQLEIRRQDLAAEVVLQKAEIRRYRDEDMLDEYGRVKCIVIDSEHEIVERLGINEFLVNAQQARRPVPLLIEKISHLLERMHHATAQDQKLSDYVDDSQRMVSTWRHKNSVVRQRVRCCDAWKSRMLQKIVSNALDRRRSTDEECLAGGHQTLFLCGLELRTEQLAELITSIKGHGGQESVKAVDLQDNKLDSSSVPVLVELLELCPNLSRIDLRHNLLDQHSVGKLVQFSKQSSEAVGDEHSTLDIDVAEQLDPSTEPDSSSLTSDSDDDIHEDMSDTSLFLSSIRLGASSRHQGATTSRLPSISPSRDRKCGSSLAGSRSPSFASDSTKSLLTSKMWSSSSSETCSTGISCSSLPSSSSRLVSTPHSAKHRCDDLLSPSSSRPHTPGSTKSNSRLRGVNECSSRPHTPGSTKSSCRLRGLSSSATSLLSPSQNSLSPPPPRVTSASSTIPSLSACESQESPSASPNYCNRGKHSKAKEKRDKATAAMQP